MSLGNHLFAARKKKGLAQEAVAEVLGVSRQTISKWELDETIPDIYQAKKLANLYGMSVDELIEIDIGVKEIQDMVEKISEKESEKIDWTKVWSKKYPILSTYQNEVDISLYAVELIRLLGDLQKKYGYNDVDALLVLKDILARVWKSWKKK
nr:helix-turn-helix transcriptional regulator [uncultured Butyricicoccus sp.]